jgi:hypothetical protein
LTCIFTEQFGSSDSAVDFYSEESRFEMWPERRPCWLRLIMFFLSSSRKCLDNTLIRLRPQLT